MARLMAAANDRALDSILRSLEFAEARLGEPIGVAEMADAACYSLFHFSRLFSATLGHAPYDYLVRRRIAHAAPHIVSGSAGILDIALEYGFDQPDTFTRAFRRCFGLSPSEARKSGSYPQIIARTLPSEAYVAFMLEHGPIRPLRLAEEHTVYTGSCPAANRVLPTPDACTIFQAFGSDPDLPGFSGTPALAGASSPAIFPSVSTILPGGDRASFAVSNIYLIVFMKDYAYRTWIPESIGPWIPPWHRIDGGEQPRLVLPLPAKASG